MVMKTSVTRLYTINGLFFLLAGMAILQSDLPGWLESALDSTGPSCHLEASQLETQAFASTSRLARQNPAPIP
jgi:hypothetical protein